MAAADAALKNCRSCCRAAACCCSACQPCNVVHARAVSWESGSHHCCFYCCMLQAGPQHAVTGARAVDGVPGGLWHTVLNRRFVQVSQSAETSGHTKSLDGLVSTTRSPQ
jgi:hypothetical protein